MTLNVFQILAHRKKTAVDKEDLECVTWPFPNISCSEWSQYSKIRTAHFRRLATRSLTVSWNTSDRLRCSGYSLGKIVYYFRGFRASEVLHTCHKNAYSQIRFFLRCTSLMIIEIFLTSKVPVAYFAGNSYIFKCARRAHHAFSTRLVAYVRHVSPTTFVTRFTEVPSCHSARQIRNTL